MSTYDIVHQNRLIVKLVKNVNRYKLSLINVFHLLLLYSYILDSSGGRQLIHCCVYVIAQIVRLCDFLTL